MNCQSRFNAWYRMLGAGALGWPRGMVWGGRPEYSLEGLMLKLKLQYFGHLMWRPDPLEKTLMLGKIEGGRKGDNRGWDGWMASLTQRTWVWASSGSWWWTGRPGVLQSMGLQRVRHNWVTELNWTSQKAKAVLGWEKRSSCPDLPFAVCLLVGRSFHFFEPQFYEPGVIKTVCENLVNWFRFTSLTI